MSEKQDIFDEEMKKAAHKIFSVMGSKGGRKTAERGPKYFREIQRKSVAARKQNSKKKQC